MHSFKHKQQGFSLFMVMIIMLVIALLVVVTTQSSSTEMRLSTNEADRKYALSLAETGLRDAENTIRRFAAAKTTTTFNFDCGGGNCAPIEAVHWEKGSKGVNLYKIQGTKSDVVAWKREINGKNVFDDGATSYSYPTKTSGAQDANSVRYIIEFLGERTEIKTGVLGRYFRVTARAKGQNPNTVVILQSYVEANGID